MSLSCSCDDDGSYGWYMPPNDFGEMNTPRRRQRCCSCGGLIDLGATVAKFRFFRYPRSDVEERIYGDEVETASKYMCERCGGLYFSLHELGFCINVPSNMLDLVKDYAETYGPPSSVCDGDPKDG